MSFDPIKFLGNPLDIAAMTQQLFSSRSEEKEIVATEEATEDSAASDFVEVNEQPEVTRDANEELVIQSQTLQSTLLAEKLRRETAVEEPKEKADPTITLDEENDKTVLDEPVQDLEAEAGPVIASSKEDVIVLGDDQTAEESSTQDLDVTEETFTQTQTQTETETETETEISSTQVPEDDSVEIVVNVKSEEISITKKEPVKVLSISQPEKKKKLSKAEKKKIKVEKKKQQKLEKKKAKKADKQAKANKKANNHHTKNKEHNKK